MASHSSVFAWRIPGMAEPGGLSSMGSHRVGHDWSDLAAAIIFDVLSTCYRLNCVLPEVLEVLIHSTCECDLIFEQDFCSWSIRVSPNPIWLVSFIKMEHYEHRHKWKTMWGYWENILYKSRNSYSCALQVESFTSLAAREAQVLEWVAFPFSSGSSRPMKQNQGLLHCKQIFYELSYQERPLQLSEVGKGMMQNYSRLLSLALRTVKPYISVVKITQFILLLCQPVSIEFMGFSRQEYWSGLSFPSPVDHVLSELFTMTHRSWVALHCMAHSFIEFDKAETIITEN